MTRQDLSNENTTMIAEGDELLMVRVFEAPRELVWAAMTSPEHVPHWWGPRGTTTVVAEMDVRPGGKWRWINQFDGGEAPFSGEYLEVVRPERIVRTAIFDAGPPGEHAVETITLEESDGRTTMTYHTRFPSQEVLDFALAQGMSKGTLEQLDRLEELLVHVA